MVLIERANYLFVTVASVERRRHCHCRRRRRRRRSTPTSTSSQLKLKSQERTTLLAVSRIRTRAHKKLEIKTLIKKAKKKFGLQA